MFYNAHFIATKKMLLVEMVCKLTVMVLIFGEVDVVALDEKGGGQRSDDYYSSRLSIGVLDSNLASSTKLYVLQQCYNSQFRF